MTLRKPYRAVYQYPDNGYPNANAVWFDEPTTRRLALAKATYLKRFRLKKPKQEQGRIWVERLNGDSWELFYASDPD